MNVQRKKRIVKNALVNTDDVSVECGTDYANWIPIARKKIKVTQIHK